MSSKIASGKTSRNFTFDSGADLPADVTLEIWRQPGGDKVAGGTTLAAVLAGSARSQALAVAAGEEIYVLAMNTGKNPRDVAVTVSESTTALALDLTGSFACTARTHKESGPFTSQSQWIDMGKGYLQLLTTPTWQATWTSAGVDAFICDGSCTGAVSFKPTRLTP